MTTFEYITSRGSDFFAMCFWGDKTIILSCGEKQVLKGDFRPNHGCIFLMQYWSTVTGGSRTARLDCSDIACQSNFNSSGVGVFHFDKDSRLKICLKPDHLKSLSNGVRKQLVDAFHFDRVIELEEVLPEWVKKNKLCLDFWDRTQIPCPLLTNSIEKLCMDRHLFYYSLSKNIDVSFSEQQLLYWENACLFFLAAYGIAVKKFCDKPLKYQWILGQVLGLHCWSIPYTQDTDSLTNKKIEQTWPLLVNPVERHRTGDCEDSGHDVRYNFQRLKGMRAEAPIPDAVAALRVIAEQYTCCLVEGVLRCKNHMVYHVYCLLFSHYDMEVRTGYATGDTSYKNLPVIWVEPTHPNDTCLDRHFDRDILHSFLREMKEQGNSNCNVPLRLSEINKKRLPMYRSVMRLYNDDLFWKHDVLSFTPATDTAGADIIASQQKWIPFVKHSQKLRKALEFYDSIHPKIKQLSISRLSDLSAVPSDGFNGIYFFKNSYENEPPQYKNCDMFKFNVTDNIFIYVYFKKP